MPAHHGKFVARHLPDHTENRIAVRFAYPSVAVLAAGALD
jgi:hypothetical protein